MVTFGTSGHRGIINESFTIEDVRAIGQAVAVFLRESTVCPKVIVGYDSRLGNDPLRSDGSFTCVLVQALIEQGVTVYFCSEPTPTPVVSWAIESYGFDGGLILTASHNPPNYNGLKFNPSNGAPAPEAVTQKIEALANSFLLSSLSPVSTVGEVKPFDAKEAFAAQVFSCVSALTGVDLRKTGLVLALDTKFGACAAQWRQFLLEMGSLEARCILHPDPDPTFGGINPNPTDKASLHALKALQSRLGASLAIANDPDGDRHVVLDELGQFVSPEELTVIVLHFLHRHQIPVFGVGTTVASSRIVTQLAERLGVSCVETKVGFKYFAPFLEEARQSGAIGLCVESSGGFSVSSHTLEKCGFLPGLLLAAIAMREQKSISYLKAEALALVPPVVFLEIQKTFDPNRRSALVQFFNAFDVGHVSPFSQKIVQVVKQDGLKLIFDNGDWVLMRLSGTEPVMRLYGEAASQEAVSALLNAASEFSESLA